MAHQAPGSPVHGRNGGRLPHPSSHPEGLRLEGPGLVVGLRHFPHSSAWCIRPTDGKGSGWCPLIHPGL